MDVIVTGRRCSISEGFKDKVTERLGTVERFRDRVQRVDVQVTATPNQQPDHATQVEITLHGRGPVVRAVATADDKAMAFEHALDRLKSQLRRAADRRKVHRGLRVAETLDPELVRSGPAPSAPEPVAEEQTVQRVAGLEITGDGPLVVREKIFAAEPLTLAQALDEMELVGHDFFLYVDADTRAPSVVYRRKAYDYGVIHLDLADK
ncbi:MAG: ribosome hibernation-promoting factor, HPF/YfiA family [Propioniciclava sp.]